MTEEEIEKQAEDYANEHTQILYNDCIVIDNDYGRQKQAFQAGAKWGMEHAIQWHEIKCCPQDLPPRSNDDYLKSVVVSNEYGEPIYYDYGIDEWCDMEGDIVSECYKHWCELPTYKG